MADKRGGEEGSAQADLENVLYREEILSIVSTRLSCIIQEPRKTEILKVLNKRKRKWKKRHKTETRHQPAFQPLDPQLREEQESTYFKLSELKEKLAERRREGFASARHYQKHRGGYHLQSFDYWLQTTRESLHSSRSEPPSLSHSLPQEEETQHNQLIKELESAISQANNQLEIQTMKTHMTPKLPPLHNSTHSESIFNHSSLGVLHLNNNDASINDMGLNGSALPLIDMHTEFVDKEHAELSIAKVVNISQDNCVEQEEEEDRRNSEGSNHSELPQEEEIVKVDNDSIDDTPGVGMEVVCGADVDMSPMVTQSHEIPNMIESSSSVAAAAMMDGVEDITQMNEEDMDITNCSMSMVNSSQHPLDVTRTLKSHIETDSGYAITTDEAVNMVDMSTDNDSDTQFGKLLEVIERAPYELRIPSKQGRYSDGYNRRKRRKSSMTNSKDRPKK